MPHVESDGPIIYGLTLKSGGRRRLYIAPPPAFRQRGKIAVLLLVIRRIKHLLRRASRRESLQSSSV